MPKPEQVPSFITSVADEKHFYKTTKPIIAVAGKSNVGKSSLINMLANRKKLAKTSVTPGRTRLINYFDFGEFVLADLPGYGFARVGKEEKKKWGYLMDAFLSSEDLSLLIMLVDSRHEPTADDMQMMTYLYHYAIPFIVVATKSDKLSKSAIKNQRQKLAGWLKLGVENITMSSAETRLGREEIFGKISAVLKAQKQSAADHDVADEDVEGTFIPDTAN